jgi:dephospho-CoA kinase
MLKIGLTGGIGSGKTTVSDLFADLGVPVIDTDVIARELTEKSDVLNEISVAFGDTVLLESGKLDRNKLAQLVFQDDKARARLEAILHPMIRNAVADQLLELSSQRKPPNYVIIVIPLLFETGFKDLINRVLVITSDQATRIQRVLERDDRSREEIQSIIAQQVSDEVRITEADDIIVNDADEASIAPQVKKLHHSYITLSEQQG